MFGSMSCFPNINVVVSFSSFDAIRYASKIVIYKLMKSRDVGMDWLAEAFLVFLNISSIGNTLVRSLWT